MKYVQLSVLFLLILFTQCSPANKTGGNTAVDVSQLVNSKNFTFIAQYAQPLGGRQIALTTSSYTLMVKSDSLISYLPYYGQSYVAPINPSDAGIQFTSTNFDYVATPTRNGGYNITIKPHQEAKASQLILNITSTGYANLQVSSTNRQSINFKGILQTTGR